MIQNIADLIRLISHGVYIVSVRADAEENAFTAAWVMQASFDPLLLCFSINPEHRSYPLLKQGGVCVVNVLDSGQLEIAEHFGRSDLADKMTGFNWTRTHAGAPILADSLAYFDCRVAHFVPAGDHELCICEVIDADRLKTGEPMLYVQTGNMDGSQNIYTAADAPN